MTYIIIIIIIIIIQSDSGQITEICLHGIIIYLSIKLSLLCQETKTCTDSKNCFFYRGTRLFKRRGSAENTLISNYTQRKPKAW